MLSYRFPPIIGWLDIIWRKNENEFIVVQCYVPFLSEKGQYILKSLKIIFPLTKNLRMPTSIKAKLKKSDGQTNIGKYIESTHKILQNIISEKNVFLRH